MININGHKNFLNNLIDPPPINDGMVGTDSTWSSNKINNELSSLSDEIDNQITNRGAWSSSTDYKVNDMVISDNFAYICTVANKNQKPSSESTYWVNFNRGGSGSGSVEETVTTYTQMNDKVTSYLSDTSSYTDDNYASVSVASNYKDSSQTTWERPNDIELEISSNGTLFILDEQTSKGWSDIVSKGSYFLRNIVPEHWYTCIVRDANGSMIENMRIKGSGFLRMLFIPGSGHNFRDIGGWSADGGKIKYGKIIRGGQLDTYNTNDKKVYPLLNQLGISYLHDLVGVRVDVDLRSNEQVTGITSSLLGADVNYYHSPYSDIDYRAIVDHNGAFVQQTRKLMLFILENVNNHIPVYIHCQAGADRTGTVLFVLESLLGVSAVDCDRDYEITTFYYGGMVARYRTGSSWVALRKYFDSLDGSNLQAKALTWCKLMGIPVNIVNKFRNEMIDGTPTELSYNNDVSVVVYTSGKIASTNKSVTENSKKYTADFSSSVSQMASAGFSFNSISVVMGGIDITKDVVDYDTYKVTIPIVTGDIIISGRFINNAQSVFYELDNVTSSNSVTTVTKGERFSTMLMPTASYEMKTVKIMMGDTDVTSSVYNNSTGTVDIPSVTGDIAITASASLVLVNMLSRAINTDGSAYNGGLGYKNNTRLNSSGNEASFSGVTCTGFIPFKTGQTLEIHDISLPATGATGTTYTENAMHFYDKNFVRVALPAGGYRCQSVYSTTYANPKSATSNGFIEKISMSVANIEYVRFSTSVAYGSEPTVYVY